MKPTFIALLALCLCLHVAVSAEDTYLDTLVKLRVPKKENKRSTEGGLEHVPFRIWLPEGVKTIRGVTFNPFYTKAVTQKHWQAACRQWGFGILAANFFGAKNDEIPGMIDAALTTFAKESQFIGDDGKAYGAYFLYVKREGQRKQQ